MEKTRPTRPIAPETAQTTSRRPKPLFAYVATLESDTTPRTVRGTVRASPTVALRAAFNAVRRQYPGARWDSCVVLLTKPRSQE